MGFRAPVHALGFAVCAILAICTVFVARSAAEGANKNPAQAESNASPIYGITIPPGYRDWRLISVKRLTRAGGKLKQLRAQLGNDIAMKAFRDGTIPFPDGNSPRSSFPMCAQPSNRCAQPEPRAVIARV